MLQPTSTKAKSNRREPKQSKKPRVTELVVDERVTIPVEPEEVRDFIKEITDNPTLVPEFIKNVIEEGKGLIEEGKELIEEGKELMGVVVTEPTTEPKTQCPCGSLITTKSLTKHYSTKKHTSWLFAQEATSLVL